MDARSPFQAEFEKRGAHGAAGVYSLGNADKDEYWSNLSRDENAELLRTAAKCGSAEQAMRKLHPEFYDVIYSPKRQAGLEFLDLTGDEVAIDYGCMWGALTIPLAKRIRHVLGIDQTEASLQFLAARKKESGVDNVTLLRHNLKTLPSFETKADIAIVNGVLEWIPEQGPIALKEFLGKRDHRENPVSPRASQLAFLRKVHADLKPGGKIYLAIENRFDLRMFLGYRDPHAGLFLTSIMPRAIADFLSQKTLGRPYVNWIYSFPETKQLLLDAGFFLVDLYTCFPDYRYPDWIAPYSAGISKAPYLIPQRNERGGTSLKRLAAHAVERMVLRFLHAAYFSPSIIAIAQRS